MDHALYVNATAVRKRLAFSLLNLYFEHLLFLRNLHIPRRMCSSEFLDCVVNPDTVGCPICRKPLAEFVQRKIVNMYTLL